ncbi:MAG: molybdopterin-dependent oxidoreductase [Methylovulum miyakonense]|uniref:molybdopterin-dependent oxidoreductase n=1 Tax=Methylovulum miyakonense TaxID=645578 RepID=UPI003BB6FB2A
MTQTIQTTCPYCGVGCGISATVGAENRQVQIKGDKTHPANFGRLCSKGSALGETVELQGRLLEPRIHGQPASWEAALDLVANTLLDTMALHGKDSVAIYGSGQLLTEDYYVANKLMKGFIGNANIDTNSRLCMSSSVAGHKRAFGADAVPGCYEDYELADLIVLIGSNTAWCHPVSFQRIRAAKEANPNLKIVVIDPRRTSTCDIADLHLPLAAGSDTTLFNGLLNHLAGCAPEGIKAGRREAYHPDDEQRWASLRSAHPTLDVDFIDNHTEGFEAALAAASLAGDVQQVAEYCQLAPEAVRQFYDWFTSTEKAMSLYSQGVNQSASGTDKVNSIINCHLATGRIGKPGMGPFSLTGQPNAMGGREVGGLSHQLAAHMDFTTPGDIDRVARFWQTGNIPEQGGLPAVALFDAVYEGKVKAVWIMGTNPVVSLPNADKVKQALQNCDFVVVSDCIADTDTAAFAHVLLPAQGWSEKNGTVTNSERRISRQRSLFNGAGNAKPDWWIICQVARRMGYAEAFAFQHPVEIFREHAALSGFENNGGRDFDISAFADISLDGYDSFQPVQWPVNAQHPHGTARLFSDGRYFTPSGKAQFIAITPRPPVNLTDADYPLILNTGRLRDQWHTMTRTALASKLNQHKPEPFVEVHPDDAAAYQLPQNSLASLETRWGSMTARVQITDSQIRGNVFVPMHWTGQYASDGRMGALVNPAVDPVSKQPECKHTPVRIRPCPMAWYGFILSRRELAITSPDYWVKVKGEQFYRYELAGRQLPETWQDWATTQLGDGGQGQWQEYQDSHNGNYRAALFNDGHLDSIVFIASHINLPERNWLASLFAKDGLDQQERLALLTGKPPIGVADVGAIVCACFNVGEKTICNAVKELALKTPQEVGKCLKAGTNCGSCVPEIKALLAGLNT